MIEAASRSLCRAALAPCYQICPHCNNDPKLCMWESFRGETEVVLETIKRFAIIQMRNKIR